MEQTRAVGIGPYTDDEPWESYVERLDMYFLAVGITDADAEKKKGILLASVGKEVYQLMKNLLGREEKPHSKTYTELCNLVKKHKTPTPPWQSERLKFLNRDRNHGETVMNYVAELKRLAHTCRFSEHEYENALRDRLMHGIKDERMQLEMIKVGENMTFQNALDVALKFESMARSIKDMKDAHKPVILNSKQPGQNGDNAAVHWQNGGSYHSNRRGQSRWRYNGRHDGQSCWRCYGKHDPEECKFKEQSCFLCQGKGHVRTVCPNRFTQNGQTNTGSENRSQRGRNFGQSRYGRGRGRGNNRGQRGRGGQSNRGRQNSSGQDGQSNSAQHYMDVAQGESSNDVEHEYSLYNMPTEGSEPSHRPINVSMEVQGKSLSMEVDTGATFSVVGMATAKQLWGENQLQPSNMVLQTYSKEQLRVKGELGCTVKYKEQTVNNMKLYVVPGDRPALLGRDWLAKIKLDWNEIGLKLAQVNTVTQTKDIVTRYKAKYPKLFENTLGKMEGYKANIRMKPNTVPKFCKAAAVPYALKEELSAEIDRKVALGILQKIDFAEWASRIVVVRKTDNTIRMCGDFKPTVNPNIEIDQYPLPTQEDLFTKLAGGVKFSVLDLSHAYEQIELSDESKQYLVLNTHKGLYRYSRLTYGVASAPAIFQNVMESLLGDIPNLGVFLDDIIVTGRTESEHDQNVDEALSRLNKANLRVKLDKCTFGADEVSYLGHRINATGIHPLPDKIDAIAHAPAPQNLTELRSFLGMVQYYQRFLNHLSTKLEPLHELLRENNEYKWTERQQKVFDLIKKELQSAPILVHYDASKPLVLSCDASPYGVAGVLSHVNDTGQDQPIAYASRKLSPAERNYSQLDKEGLAIVFAVKKFHKYISGRHVEIHTDHKPLLGLLGEHKSIPQNASPRVQRWAITLAAYDYTLTYRPGSENGNVDCLSRLPVADMPGKVPIPQEINHVTQYVDSMLSVTQIRLWTKNDPVLSHVVDYVMSGWPNELSQSIAADIKPYSQMRDELSVEDGVIMRGCRVVIPLQGRDRILAELHSTHPGITRMKALARSYVYWPGIDTDIEKQVKSCHTCQVNRKNPPEAPLHPWEWPTKPWYRVHADFAGPFLGKMFFILIDAHTKWMEVHIMSGTTATATIEKLEESFAALGLPVNVVTDNAAVFMSQELKHFFKANGIQHITSAPYKPSTNGLAERAVQIFKSALKKMTQGSLQSRVSKFLARYRITPQSTTGVSPANLMGRKIRCPLDQIKPDLSMKVLQKQAAQKADHDKHCKERTFDTGDKVYYRNYSKYGEPYCPGVISRRTGPVSAEVTTPQGIVRRHFDQMLQRHEVFDTVTQPYQEPDNVLPETFTVHSPTVTQANLDTVPQAAEPAVRRYPIRATRGKQPDRLTL